MENRDNIIINEKAELVGIDGEIEIDDEVMRNLTPSSYLKTLGLTLEQRIENLLLLVKANLYPNVADDKKKQVYYIPLNIVRGPFIREEVFPVFVELKEDGSSKHITIRKAHDDSNED